MAIKDQVSGSMRSRWYADLLQAKMRKPFVHIMFGARQTGKSTLLDSLLPAETLCINMADPAERNSHLAHPDEFAKMCKAHPATETPRYVFVDEAQAVPHVFDAVQSLYDKDKHRWRFVLCGSSARKLRRSGANLLPGRALMHHLYPLVFAEQPPPERSASRELSPLFLPWPGQRKNDNPFPAWDLDDRLGYGALPGVVLAEPDDRIDLLKGYALAYLEEEIRREAYVKDWGAFLRFLQLAARESGGVVNYAAVSRETGISQPTVKSHYQLLEDMFVGLTVPAFSGSPRKNLASSPRFLFFDLGVRNAAAGLNPDRSTVAAQAGSLFEQWVGIELWKRLQYLGGGRLHYFRTEDGSEVDYIVERDNSLIPVEVKWTEHPSRSDCRHVRTFLREHPGRALAGWIVCRCAHPLEMEDGIRAIPWQCL